MQRKNNNYKSFITFLSLILTLDNFLLIGNTTYKQKDVTNG